VTDDDSRDPAADTGQFQRFADEGAAPSGSNLFRLLTLAGGLVAFVAIVWLLLR
jgi:hypothetical protein